MKNVSSFTSFTVLVGVPVRQRYRTKSAFRVSAEVFPGFLRNSISDRSEMDLVFLIGNESAQLGS